MPVSRRSPYGMTVRDERGMRRGPGVMAGTAFDFLRMEATQPV
jgi:hypothetical protein